MTKIGNLLAVFSVLFVSFPAWALLSVQATVNSNQTSINEPIVLTVSVISDESVEIENPRLADVSGFRLDNVWDSTSVSQKMVSTPSGMDWQSQRRRDFNFTLTPMKAGRLSVPALEVKVNGKVYNTQPILVTVSNTPTQKPQQVAPNRRRLQLPNGMTWPGQDDMDAIDKMEEEKFNQLLNRRAQQGGGGNGNGQRHQADPQVRTLPTNPNEAFYVQVEVDKDEVYEGEQVTATWNIYTRGQMESLDRIKFPDLKGFWKEVIEEVPSIQFTEEIVNGVPYRKALMASHALFPIKPGTAVIDEYKIKSRVRLPQNFGMGFGNAIEYTRSSSRVPIKVKPLPTEGRPSDFAGAVGQFEVQTSVESQKFPVNQPFSLRLRFEGFGNAKMIDLPAIAWPNNLEVYDTKTESKFFKDGHSYKQFDILLIPREKGVLHIPEISVSLFDPSTKKYYQKKTSAIDLEISENTNENKDNLAQGTAPTAPKTPKGPQIPAPVADFNAGNITQAMTGNPLAVGGFYLVILLGLLVKARNELGLGQKKKSLKEIVDRKFKKVDEALKAKDHKKVGAELMNVFYFLLGEATGQGGAVQELGTLLNRVPPSVRRELGDPLKKAFEIYQILTFAPEDLVKNYSSPDALKKLVSEGRDLSRKLLAALLAQTPEE